MTGYIANVGAFDENFKILNKLSAKLNIEQSRALKEIKNINLEGFKVINFHGSNWFRENKSVHEDCTKKTRNWYAMSNSCS